MKFVSWNVNGLRACMGKGFMDSFKALDADFFCLQETKLQEGQITMDLPGYHQYWCYAEKKGYSGTAIFTRHEPRSVSYGLGIPELDTEGRVITLEYDEFYLVTCYTPNAQRGLARIEHRLKWEESFRCYLNKLDEQKPVILCGDLNVAHQEIDLKNPSSNRGNAGFSDEERSAFTALLDSGFTDSFRHLYPDKTGAYSWWSYMFNARQNNAGWRIDYFVVSDRLADAIHDATIHPDIMGSDHCPVGLDLNTLCNGGIPVPPPDLREPEQPKEADGNKSVGLGRILITLAVFLSVIAVLTIPLFFPDPEPEKKPNPSMVVIPQMESPPIISDVIIRTGTIRPTVECLDPYFSALPDYYFISGEERFRLEPIPASLMPEAEPNYYVQVVFSDTRYTDDDKPSVITGVTHYSTNTEHYRYCRYYYGENGTIAGCFIYGYTTHNIDLSITAYYGEISCARGIDVTPTFDFDSISTEELLNLIDNSYMIQYSSLLSHRGLLDKLLETEPTLLELLSREDAVRTLLDYYADERKQAIVPSLLFHSKIKALMTPDEQTEFKILTNSIKVENPPDSTNLFHSITIYDTPPELSYLSFGSAMGGYALTVDNELYSLQSTVPNHAHSYNFCVRIELTPEYSFTKANQPVLTTIELPYEGIDSRLNCIHTSFYFDNGMIAGYFVYGHISWATVINTIITEEGHCIGNRLLHVNPIGLSIDPSQFPTDVLVSYLANSEVMLYASVQQTPAESIDYYLETSPFAQELLTRPDAIDTMVRLSSPKDYGLRTLFYSSLFSPLATDEQIAAFEDGWSTIPT